MKKLILGVFLSYLFYSVSYANDDMLFLESDSKYNYYLIKSFTSTTTNEFRENTDIYEDTIKKVAILAVDPNIKSFSAFYYLFNCTKVTKQIIDARSFNPSSLFLLETGWYDIDENSIDYSAFNIVCSQDK